VPLLAINNPVPRSSWLGLVPAIHVLASVQKGSRGCLAQGRA
jgi:hypothetical protein